MKINWVLAVGLLALTATARGEQVEVAASATSEERGYEAARALDGDPDTMWHTAFADGKHPPLPQALTVDLRAPRALVGVVITPRRDACRNGDIKRYEIFVADDPAEPGEPVLSGAFAEHAKQPRTLRFDAPRTGRYLTVKVVDDFSTFKAASIAELQPLVAGDAALTFRTPRAFDYDRDLFYVRRPAHQTLDPAPLRAALGPERFEGADAERVTEYLLLERDIRAKPRFDAIASQTLRREALILDGDRDPLDVVLRRTAAVAVSDAGRRALAALRGEAGAVPVADTAARFDLFLRVCRLRRAAMFASPLLDFDRILFVKKHRATYSHMCDQYYGINAQPGGGLCVLEEPFRLDRPPRMRDLLENSVVENGRLAGRRLAGTGSFLAPDLSFDARRIAFAYVECAGSREHIVHTDPARGHWDPGRSLHIFTCSADGSGLRQLTDGSWNDFDPCWLPNGRIAFISERRGGYLRCGRACPTFTLFDMDADGSRMRCLSYHETNEWHPSVTADGRILYTRWDYPDRHGRIAHQPWITTLDGRDPRHVHGNFALRTLRPDMELDCRQVPGSPKFIATAAPHHGQAYGSLVLIDPRVEEGDDPMAPLKRITPDVDFPETQGGGQIYGAPWPLSEDLYLCVADLTFNGGWEGQKYERGDYGIYLLDAYGNRELVYRDPEIGCNSPIPLRAVTPPPAPPSLVSDTIEHQPYVAPLGDRIDRVEQGTVLVLNAYKTRAPLPADARIKALRVIQLVPMSVPSGKPPHETGFREPSASDAVVLARNVLGTVPVEADGSAHFTVPPRREFILQLVDEEGLAVQSMRSSIYLHDGERLSCSGCHEQTAQAAVPAGAVAKAFSRAPSKLEPDHPDSNPFSFPRLVQPVLDKHCAACHAAERAKGTKGVPNLAREPIRRNWYASFNELVPEYGFYNYGDPLRTIPGKFGARASRLYAILKRGHHDVNLSPEEFRRITLWLDCVSPFYGVYEKEGGLAQLRGERVFPTLE